MPVTDFTVRFIAMEDEGHVAALFLHGVAEPVVALRVLGDLDDERKRVIVDRFLALASECWQAPLVRPARMVEIGEDGEIVELGTERDRRH